MALDELIVFSSSGTTGHPTRTAHHPFSAACGVPLIEYALRTLHQLEFPRGAESIAITNFAAYPGAFTTAIVIAYLQEAGCIRVNLDPSAWRQPEDRRRYLDAWPAPVWLGDPIAFEAMESIELRDAPNAIVSSIMHLSDAQAARLQGRYGCPVLDLYAMTEAGIIAVKTQAGYRILPHDLHVEILDPVGNPCPPGVRGEITLTGGRNPFLPLLRYRTADFAAIRTIDGHRVLVDFEGRQPMLYTTSSGHRVHSMEVTRLMRRFPVFRYAMRSTADGFALDYEGSIDAAALSRELASLFRQSVELNCLRH